MRINRYVALATGLGRRKVDLLIAADRVKVNGQPVGFGKMLAPQDQVTVDGKLITQPSKLLTIMLNKPVGYVCSRAGQGTNTIYDLLPKEFHNLKPVGRLDKDSSGLLLLTNDGKLAQKLTHPSFQKQKIYEIELDKPLSQEDMRIIEQGIMLEDGISRLKLKGKDQSWTVIMHEGRNRQIRRTFGRLGYTITRLHRTQFGNYTLGSLASGKTKQILV